MSAKNAKYHFIDLAVPGSVSTGDAQAAATFPFARGEIDQIIVSVGTSGTTAGNTSVQLARERAGTSTDLLTAVSSIAYNATTLFNELFSSDLDATDIVQGDVLSLDVDAVPTGASANLAVHVRIRVREDGFY